MGRRFPDGRLRDTENESLNNWEMLSNKGVGTANQWERSTATRQPITTLLIFCLIDRTLALTHFFWSTG